MKKLLLVGALVGVFGAVPAVASAETLSTGCAFLNHPDWDDAYTVGLSTLSIGAGEVVYMESSVATVGNPIGLELMVDFEVVSSNAFPGAVSWTFPAEGTYDVWWQVTGGAEVEWNVSCGAAEPEPQPSADADQDGVIDEYDLCDGTTLFDPPEKKMKNRYFVGESGEFVDGYGNDSGITIEDTGGCDEDQIAAAMELGKGHERFGLTRGALEEWLASP